jgi:hypothetical protein
MYKTADGNRKFIMKWKISFVLLNTKKKSIAVGQHNITYLLNYLITYLINYLIHYLITYLLHGAESFFRS